MPLERLASAAGVYRPEELKLLGRVFDRLVQPSDDAPKREALASRVIGYYLMGIKDEDELVALSRQPLHR